VVLISVDTLRADHLPAYGYSGVATPAIDGLRRDGILFANAYAAVPLTLPSHVTLLTGLLPYRSGVRDNIGFRLGKGPATLAEILAAQGYDTAGFVSAYVLRRETGIARGFRHYDDRMEEGGHSALGELQRPGTATVARAVAWLRGPRTGPPFLFLHLFEPHSPYTPPPPFDQSVPSAYDGEIAAADAALGTFFQTLRELGLYDRALIVFLSDHGEGLNDHGEAEHGILLYREALHVPLVVKLPNNERAGERVERVAGLVDVLPTIAEVAAAEAPDDLPGRSLVARGSDSERELYSETYYARLHLGWSGLRSLVGDRWHYIEAPRPELYDVVADPGERHDLSDEQPAVLRRMRSEMRKRHPRIEPTASSVSKEEASKLSALGYLTAPSSRSGETRPDPKDALPALAEAREIFTRVADDGCKAALPSIHELLEKHPGMQDVRVQLAECLRASGDLEGSLAEYRRILQQSPASAEALLIDVGSTLLALGRLDEAQDHAEAALVAYPADAHDLLARIARARGDLAGARKEAKKALATAHAPRPDTTLLLANLEMHAEQYAEALAVLAPLHAKIAMGSVPAVANLEYIRADALARLGRYDEAEAAFRAEVEAFPRNSQAWADLALLYAAMHRPKRIDATLDAMVAAAPGRDTMLLAARTAERLGNSEAAARWRRRARAAPATE
jgi:choline-sulfatase